MQFIKKKSKKHSLAVSLRKN